MSFEVVCSSCGAISGPSVGMCPYCKNVVVQSGNQVQGQGTVSEHYAQGHLDLALSLIQKIYKEDQEAKQDVRFLLLYVKILIETEGPSSLINGLLMDAQLKEPGHQELMDYYEIVQAKSSLKKGAGDAGELSLKNVLKRSPENVHALFLLAAHIFWIDKDATSAIFYLERCVNLSPNFLRGWGCLAAVYKAIGNSQLSLLALQNCVRLEANPTMKQVFVKEMEKVS